MDTKIIEIPHNYLIDKIEDGKIYLVSNAQFINSITELRSLHNYLALSSKHKDVMKLLLELLILRDNYRDNDEPFNSNTTQYAIKYENGELFIIATIGGNALFEFQSKGVAKLFLDNFRNELKKFYEIIYKL